MLITRIIFAASSASGSLLKRVKLTKLIDRHRALKTYIYLQEPNKRQPHQFSLDSTEIFFHNFIISRRK